MKNSGAMKIYLAFAGIIVRRTKGPQSWMNIAASSIASFWSQNIPGVKESKVKQVKI